MAKVLPFSSAMRAGLLSHGVGNYSGGVGNLSNAIYGGNRDYNITKHVYSSGASEIGFSPSFGSNAFYVADMVMGVTLLVSPTVVTGTSTIRNTGAIPLQLETYKSQLSFMSSPKPILINDIYQLYSAENSITLNEE